MPKPALPLDVCLEIIDACADLDGRCTLVTLRACALTCSAWLHRSRYHIYKTVRLDEPSEERRQLFFRTIVQSPALGALVKEIYVYLWEENALWTTSEADTPTLFPEDVFRNLSSLRSLDLELKTLSIAGCFFDDLRDLIHFLEHFAELEVLVLRVIYWINPFILHDTSRVLPSFCQNLRRLELAENVIDDPLLHVMPATIETLTIGPRDSMREDDDPPESYEGLARFLDLRSLTLRTQLQDDTQWFMEALSFARCTKLETLCLTYWGGLNPVEEGRLRTQAPRLRKILEREPFVNLTNVRISVDSMSDQDVDARCRYIQDCITSAFRPGPDSTDRSRYVLEVKVTVRSLAQNGIRVSTATV
ncbi:hypothetical protein PYCCODRAFT_397301 [Trametes coccinea BRFM310]|uniref:F-box domain-containing protein n=1 Tax=Trametes coccinea (strain BRFM310) TaxID=1353009 RepID=A0A1Y2IMN4_TRAC3|nr:hypothetical protein PYCCODRAFT_397301 [Trametes coccinea BRFM310]